MAGAGGPLTGSSVTVHMMQADALPANPTKWATWFGAGKLLPLTDQTFAEQGIAASANRVKHVAGDLDLSVPGDPLSIKSYGEAPTQAPRLGEPPPIELDIGFRGTEPLHVALRDAALATKYILGRLSYEAADKATLQVCLVSTSGKPMPASTIDDDERLKVGLARIGQVYSIDQGAV